MKKAIRRPPKDERDEQIEVRSKYHALTFVVAFTQVLTVMCIIKGNPAWRGSLSILFFGAAVALFYKYDQYEEPLYRQVGIVLGLIAAALLVWFGIAG